MTRTRVLIATVFGSVTILGALSAVLIPPRQPQIPPDGPVWFQAGVNRVQLSDAQARSLRSMLAMPAQYDRSADSKMPQGFFYLDDRCYYWRGLTLKLRPESGAHWVWRGGKCLERMAAWADGVYDETRIRAFLQLLDSP
jgi:hypothetical protein